MLVTAIAVKIDSKGSVFYRNERIGRDGDTIELFKFRSMKLEYCIGNKYGGEKAKKIEDKLITERNLREGPLYKIKDDPRITGIGKFIRKYSIDEMPQFLNVLKGEISLVGPRPHTPREVSRYPKDFYKKVLTIRPGITGLAQISGRSDLDFKDEAKLDTYYIENWTLLTDLNIILLTPFKLFSRRKAL